MATIMFEDLCKVLEKICTKRKNRPEQDVLLGSYVEDVKLKLKTEQQDNNVFPILRLLLPDLERERSAYNLKEAKLGLLLVKVLSLPKTSHDAQKLISFRAVKNSQEGTDFASVAYFVLNNRVGQTNSKLTIQDINKFLDTISDAETGNKGPVLDQVFTTVLKNTTAKEAKWFLRIVLKDLKLGMGKTRILAVVHPDAPELYETCNSLAKVCEEFSDGNTRPVELGVELFSAICPMLSERADVTAIEMKEGKSYHIEIKFDGERFQIHMRDGIFEYFSRKGFVYSDKYGKTFDSGGMLTPYLKDCFKAGVQSFILDGEMMGWHKTLDCFGSKGMSFDVKKITENSKFRPCFCAFDILYYNGRSLAGPPEKGGLPLSERLAILDHMFTDVHGVILHSKRQSVGNRSEVLQALEEARSNDEEGLVLKECDSYYLANKRNAGWYKIKPEYTEGAMEDLDVVIIGANYAENKRNGLARSFYVACADDVASEGCPPSRWLCLSRVATGLSFEERERLCATLGRGWKEAALHHIPPCLVFNKEKPDFWIMPDDSVVLTVRATELTRSTDYATPYTLRFPRVTALRHDKPPRDVLTLRQFNALVADKGPVVKLSNKQIQGDIPARARRKRPAKVLQVAENFRAKVERVDVTSRALFGRSVCVLSADHTHSKGDLEALVARHGGTVQANISSNTWCCIVGNDNVRTRNVITSKQADVLPSSWLTSLPPADEPCAQPKPVEYISMTKQTRMEFAKTFDIYGDSYTEFADQESMKKCFEKMDRDEPPVILTKAEKYELDKELYGDEPLRYLRPCGIYIQDTESILALKARLFGATICEIDSRNLTHVVIEKDRINDVQNYKDKGITVYIVSSDWLEECFSQNKLVQESDFVL